MHAPVCGCDTLWVMGTCIARTPWQAPAARSTPSWFMCTHHKTHPRAPTGGGEGERILTAASCKLPGHACCLRSTNCMGAWHADSVTGLARWHRPLPHGKSGMAASAMACALQRAGRTGEARHPCAWAPTSSARFWKASSGKGNMVQMRSADRSAPPSASRASRAGSPPKPSLGALQLGRDAEGSHSPPGWVVGEHVGAEAHKSGGSTRMAVPGKLAVRMMVQKGQPWHQRHPVTMSVQ
jgi:hypothetical protein